jgi:F5/8 type C domain
MKNRSRRLASLLTSAVARIERCEPRQLLSTYLVNSVSDATNPGAGLLTLRQAVTDANLHTGADSITFDPKVFTASSLHTITLLQGPITFSDATGTTTVTGPGATVAAVSGDSKTRVFNIYAGATVVISGLTIIDGNQTTPDANGIVSGGGISNAGMLTINNSTISGNTATAPTESDFDNGDDAWGGGIVSTGPLTIVNSTLNSNSAVGGVGYFGGRASGGAIACFAPLLLSGDTFTNNSALGANPSQDGERGGAAAGGAVYATDTVTMTSTTISGNYATGGNAPPTYSADSSGGASGGGVFAEQSLTITGSTITGNSATAGVSGLDSGSTGGATGGGVYAGGTLTITSSTVSTNTAKVIGYYNANLSAGGGVYAGGNATVWQSNIDDNTLIGGAPEFGAARADVNALGGGLYVGGMLDLQQSSISQNSNTCSYPVFGQPGGASEGGGLYTAGGGTIRSSTIANNSAAGGVGYSDANNDYFPASGGDGAGGGVYSAGNLTITDSTIALNSASAGAGGSSSQFYAGANGGSAKAGGVFASSLIVADSTITGNSTTAGAGGKYTGPFGDYGPGKSGTATAGGVDAATITLTNTIVSTNKAAGAFSDVAGTAGSGSDNNLIGVGGGLTDGVNGNLVGVTNPVLSPLGDYGGPTLTMVPLTGSPAIDAGKNSLIPVSAIDDQRGLARIFNSTVDIGAVEVQPRVVPITGNVIGTSGSYRNQGNTIAKVFDGNLSTFFDAPTATGGYAGLDLGTKTVISQISYAPRTGWASRMVGGKFQGSNTADFSSGVVTLYTITATPVANIMTTVSISNTTTFRYIRYIGPSNGYCNIAEMQLFTPATVPTEFPGTVIGTAGSYRNHGTTIANAFDANFSTFFDGPDASGDWVGEAFAAPVVVTQVKFAARTGYETRMVGGMIQASNTADFSSGVVTLRTIAYPPPSGALRTVTLSNTTAYRYYRYIGPSNSYCDIAELEFLG